MVISYTQTRAFSVYWVLNTCGCRMQILTLFDLCFWQRIAELIGSVENHLHVSTGEPLTLYDLVVAFRGTRPTIY